MQHLSKDVLYKFQSQSNFTSFIIVYLFRVIWKLIKLMQEVVATISSKWDHPVLITTKTQYLLRISTQITFKVPLPAMSKQSKMKKWMKKSSPIKKVLILSFLKGNQKCSANERSSFNKNFYCYFMWFFATAKNQDLFWYLMTICQYDKFSWWIRTLILLTEWEVTILKKIIIIVH